MSVYLDPPLTDLQFIGQYDSEALALERTLRDADQQRRAQARRNKQIVLNDSAAKNLRLCLLKCLEDLMVLDPVFASGKNVEEKIWNLVFYNYIEELRGAIRKAQAERDASLHAAALSKLRSHLDTATNFYQTSMLTLTSCCESSLITCGVAVYKEHKEHKDQDRMDVHQEQQSNESVRLGVIHKCLVSLGDISRYREIHNSGDAKKWHISRAYYRKAIQLVPDNGKPFSQLAILSSYSKADLEVIYWYCLSLVNAVPHSVTRENIAAFHSIYAKAEKDRSATLLPEATTAFFAFHRLAFNPKEATASNVMVPFAKVTDLVDHAAVPTSSNVLPQWFKMTVPVLIATYHDLDQSFDRTEQSNIRHAIRILEVYATAMLFRLLTVSLNVVVDFWSVNEVDVSALASGKAVPPMLEHLATASIIAIWLESNMNVFVLFGKYVKTFKEGQDVLQLTLSNLARQLAIFANAVSAFADMDGSTECLPEDVELLGMTPLRNYYSNLTSDSMQSMLNDNIAPNGALLARIARIASFAKTLADDERVDMFRFHESDGTFEVVDETSKKRGLHKLMKALATERLKDQVTTLEQNITKLKEQALPMVVFDAECYVRATSLVKKWITGGRCMVIVPLDVIDQLDYMKKGTEKHNAKAREAIRFLEQRFRYKSPFLRAQKDDEVAVSWNRHVGQLTDNSVVVPKHMRSMVACLDWYRNNVAPAPTDENDVTFALVSEDDILTQVASAYGAAIGSGADARDKSILSLIMIE
ncbi:hypothetical protein PhCBS80983_g05917 [Powellomyces hirtus]|uniref:PIN domain-containing protein n=1 Tax=Powellomyces hirtus TaxID=109895 RepID=A0A507DT77_9FUNG|nr:hypothetical protein PhCBS80983_g05917 [Powellomyces hirtus]